MRFYLMLIILAFLCIIVIGCADRHEGDARIKINLTLAPSEKQEVVITRVVVTVSGFDIETQEFELKVDGRKATGAIAIPAGEEREIKVKAYAGDTLEYEGGTLVDHPKPGEEIRIDIALKPVGSQVDGSDTSGNDAKMVLIPAGEFLMGSDKDDDNAKPAHTVSLDEFYIDMYEVTNAQYRRFIQATGRKEPEGYRFVDNESIDSREPGFKPWSDASFNAGNMPVVCVTWDDANAYAKWAGKRLPTEAEWEKASRGGSIGQRYPWGNNYPPTYKVGNLADDSFLKAYRNVDVNIKGYNDGFTYVAPVGQFPSNGYGLYDICGNVSEFCSDWYDEYYYATSPKQNPKGAVSGTEHSVRGSAWLFGDPNLVTNSMRGYIETPEAYNMLGFRCAKSTR
ncbi:MAG: formylglycine-generating enzyme family protein [Candidatus Poribacteria bacterium]